MNANTAEEKGEKREKGTQQTPGVNPSPACEQNYNSACAELQFPALPGREEWLQPSRVTAAGGHPGSTACPSAWGQPCPRSQRGKWGKSTGNGSPSPAEVELTKLGGGLSVWMDRLWCLQL